LAAAQLFVRRPLYFYRTTKHTLKKPEKFRIMIRTLPGRSGGRRTREKKDKKR
jgi:hypothetical protein